MVIEDQWSSSEEEGQQHGKDGIRLENYYVYEFSLGLVPRCLLDYLYGIETHRNIYIS